MNSIIIRGKADSGKSATIREVCKRLHPERVLKIVPDWYDLRESGTEDSEAEAIYNDAFIILVRGVVVLVSAGAPTEHGIRITTLIEICIRLGYRPAFVICAMRSYERREGYDTPAELAAVGEVVSTVWVSRIEGEEYERNPEWIARVNDIVRKIRLELGD
ncbi:MAG: hypothetical protein H6581_26715 [Bacteroidia bacterium]|nr:hypothetical protein [Bacteroidia bacterium]